MRTRTPTPTTRESKGADEPVAGQMDRDRHIDPILPMEVITKARQQIAIQIKSNQGTSNPRRRFTVSYASTPVRQLAVRAIRERYRA